MIIGSGGFNAEALAEEFFFALLYSASITPYRPCLLTAGGTFFDFLDRVEGTCFFVMVLSDREGHGH